MAAMRQRLLLVAGWLAAAIGSVLVASGAVAVAGGQVLDRPLRPLTAAEVAALPVVAVGSTDPTEPQASGGIDRTTGEPTVGSDGTEPGSTGPSSTGGSAASPWDDLEDASGDASDDASDDASEDASEDGSGRWDRFTSPGDAETAVASLEAGRASFAVAEGRLHLLWATPAAGYVIHMLHRDSDTVTISFSSSRDVWIVEARVVDGVLEVESGPAPIA